MLARELAVADFGRFNVGVALAGIMLMVASAGLPEAGTREASLRPTEGAQLLGRVAAGRAVVLAAVAAVAMAVAAAAGGLRIAFPAAAMALALALSADWLLRGLERVGALAAATAAGGVAVLAGSLLLVPLEPEPEVALGLFAAAELLVTVLTWWAAGLRRPPRPTLRGLGPLLRRSWPLGLSTLLVYSYYANLDTILLSALRSAEQAGLYSAPYRVFLALNVIGTFAAYAALPAVTRRVAAGAPLGTEALRPALAGLAAYGLAVLAGVELVGGEALEVLFGERFGGMDAVLIVLCIAIPWYSVAFPLGYALIARDARRRFLIGAALAGGLNVTLNLALIPSLGPDGAAVATTVALVAGSLAWMHAQQALGHDTLPLLALLLVASAAGCVAAAAEGAAPVVGALTALAAAALALRAGARSAR